MLKGGNGQNPEKKEAELVSEKEKKIKVHLTGGTILMAELEGERKGKRTKKNRKIDKFGQFVSN